jgi:hypothetical protein
MRAILSIRICADLSTSPIPVSMAGWRTAANFSKRQYLFPIRTEAVRALATTESRDYLTAGQMLDMTEIRL